MEKCARCDGFGAIPRCSLCKDKAIRILGEYYSEGDCLKCKSFGIISCPDCDGFGETVE
jgi:hypothetical protein